MDQIDQMDPRQKKSPTAAQKEGPIRGSDKAQWRHQLWPRTGMVAWRAIQSLKRGGDGDLQGLQLQASRQAGKQGRKQMVLREIIRCTMLVQACVRGF